MPKGTIAEIKERRKLLIQLVIEKPIQTQESAQQYLEEIHGLSVSLATINRDFHDIQFELSTDEAGFTKYILKEEELRKYNREQLSNILTGYTYDGFQDNLYLQAISVKSGYADFVGTKIMEVYPAAFMGYLTSNKLLMLISDSSSHHTLAETFLKDMSSGNFLSKNIDIPHLKKEETEDEPSPVIEPPL